MRDEKLLSLLAAFSQRFDNAFRLAVASLVIAM
uniref:Uncharacterized protein n=1 Tax=Anguilla anguilla TaxID=7936 RepID=A0A0E9W7A8_ANGAN